jgi:hypothetical protein
MERALVTFAVECCIGPDSGQEGVSIMLEALVSISGFDCESIKPTPDGDANQETTDVNRRSCRHDLSEVFLQSSTEPLARVLVQDTPKRPGTRCARRKVD